ncbi:MAG: glycosyltransferase family 4 protein [Candidatus Aenigmatarchaeota archaeon]
MKYFIYVDHPLSPHFVHLTWAKSIGAVPIKIPLNPFLQRSVLMRRDIKNFNGSDVFIVESLYSIPYLYFLKRELRPKIISIIADTTFYPPKLPLRSVFYKLFRLNWIVDYFFTVSENIKKWAINFGIDKDRIFVVRPFSMLKIEKKEIIGKEKRKKITFIGNFTKISAANIVISISKKLPDFEFNIIGTVSKKIKNPPKNVKCYMNISWEDLKKILLSSSIYLHPMFFDPFPVSVLDAMRCGNFPLVYRLVGLSEVLKSKNVLYSLNLEYVIEKLLNTYAELSNKDFLRCYKFSKKYTKEKSIKTFKRIFNSIIY